MADSPVNNRKIILNPVNKPALDIGESTMFSKKVDANLWESVSNKIMPTKPKKDDSLQSQIFKVGQETEKYQQFLSQPLGNKLDING